MLRRGLLWHGEKFYGEILLESRYQGYGCWDLKGEREREGEKGNSTNVQLVPLDVLSDCFSFNRICRYRIIGSIAKNSRKG